MPTIAFVSSKGGVGKTTASLLTALGLAARGAEEGSAVRRVAMIDADPNLPLVRWASLPNRPEQVTVAGAPTDEALTRTFRQTRFGLDALGKPTGSAPDWIIIDTEGGARRAMHMAIGMADLVITPSGPSTIEALEAVKVIGYVRQAAETLKRPIPHACVLTRLPAAIRPRSVKAVIERLRAEDIPIVPTPLVEKEAFRALFNDGGDIDSLDPKLVSGVAAAKANLLLFAEDIERLARAPKLAA